MRDADLAALCAESYLPDPTVAIGDDLAATVTETETDVIVAFRGTANPRGWMRDLDILPKSHPKIGYCHRGFLSGGSRLYQALAIPVDGRRVVLTGHSLGGALAVIYGALRIANADRVDLLVTFGAPRAGWEKLSEIWKDVEVHQYANGNDPVPDVPLTLLVSPYQHVRALSRVGQSAEEPWRCHDIRRYAALVP